MSQSFIAQFSNKRDDHLQMKCPMLWIPKTRATLFGFGGEKLGFSQVLPSCHKGGESRTSNITMVKISGAHISPEMIQCELRRRIRLDWIWELVPNGEDSYLVAFFEYKST